MEQVKGIKLNQMPAKTWNHLKMNGTEVKFSEGFQWGPVSYSQKGNIERIDESADVLEYIHTGMGEEINRLVNQTEGMPLTIRTEESLKGENSVKLVFPLEDEKNYVNKVNLIAEKDSEMTVIMDFSTDQERHAGTDTVFGEDSSVRLVQTKILAKQNSLVRLIQIHRAGEGEKIFNDTGGICEDGANIQVIHIVLGQGTVYVGCQVELIGKESSLDADIGYLIEKMAHLDMNYVSVHKGVKTQSRIYTTGVLRQHAFKLFRGTIDFKKGASEAVGDEKEDVLLLDDTVVNQTIPVILCEEEDVEGNHGATIGKLDEELLFYMESRGMNRDEIYEVISKARVEAVCRKIVDEDTKTDLIHYLEGEDLDEE